MSESEESDEAEGMLVAMGFGADAVRGALGEAGCFDGALELLEKRAAARKRPRGDAGGVPEAVPGGPGGPAGPAPEGLPAEPGAASEGLLAEATARLRSRQLLEVDGLRVCRRGGRAVLVPPWAERAVAAEATAADAHGPSAAAGGSGELQVEEAAERLLARLPAVGSWGSGGSLSLEPRSSWLMELHDSEVIEPLPSTDRLLTRLKVETFLPCADAGNLLFTIGNFMEEWRPPGALGGDARAALLAEVAELEQSGRLSRRRAGTSAAAKERDDRICWLEGGARRQPLLGSLALQLGEIAARLFPGQRPLLRPRRAMLAVYDGGGARYVRHRDNELEQGRWMNFRSVTAICYLSAERFVAGGGCGGGLRAFGADSEDQVEVLPNFGQLVFFDSRRVPHEVLPTYQRRAALTLWATSP